MAAPPTSAIERAAALPIWKGAVTPTPISGGTTNVNLKVEDGDARYVVRVGEDMPIHQIMRFNERAAAKAAHAAGISPEVVHTEPGIMVMRLIDGRTGIEVMDRDECLQMLRAENVGRVAVVDAGHPVIFPVNYAVDGETLVFRTAEGTKLDASLRGGPVSFEVDDTDRHTRTGPTHQHRPPPTSAFPASRRPPARCSAYRRGARPCR